MIDKGNQRMSVFNEVATSLYLYVTILLTEFMGDTGLRDFIGQALLGVVGGVVLVNFLRVLFSVPSAVHQKLEFHSVKMFEKVKLIHCQTETSNKSECQ
jgi:hypothetical protein